MPVSQNIRNIRFIHQYTSLDLSIYCLFILAQKKEYLKDEIGIHTNAEGERDGHTHTHTCIYIYIYIYTHKFRTEILQIVLDYLPLYTVISPTRERDIVLL